MLAVGDHSNRGGAECPEERGAEETLAGGAGQAEGGDQRTQEERETSAEPGSARARFPAR